MAKSWFQRQIDSQAAGPSKPGQSPPPNPSDADPSAPGDHKTMQLCKEVEHTVNLVLADQNGLLQELMVVAVVPAPDSGHLKVIVSPGDPKAELDEDEVLDALAQCTGRLRSEVANAVNRRKTPELGFAFRRPSARSDS